MPTDRDAEMLRRRALLLVARCSLMPADLDLRLAARRESALVLMARCYLARHRARRARQRARWLVPKARYVVKKARAVRRDSSGRTSMTDPSSRASIAD